MTNYFAREQRIVKTDDFSSVFRMRPKYRTTHFVLYCRKSAQKQARLGIVVAKRFAPRAVTRNTIKRACREFFRLGNFPACDYIVRLSAIIHASDGAATNKKLKQQVQKELRQLFASEKQ